MSVSAGYGKLQRAAKDLHTSWNRTRQDWRDPNSEQFEENYLNPLLAKLKTAEKAMGHMGDVLHRIHRDCT